MAKDKYRSPDEVGYHLPWNFTKKDHKALLKDPLLKALIKKYNVTRAFLIFNYVKAKPSTIYIKL